MAEIFLNLDELFEDTHGYKTQAFTPKLDHVTGDGDSKSDRKNHGTNGSDYYATAGGVEYYLPVLVEYSNDQAPADTNPGNTQAGGNTATQLTSWYLPYPVISVTSKKKTVETVLTERRGTVKELINVADYEIIIKGFIIGSTHEFPEDTVAKLRMLYEQNVPISIACPVTDIFLLRPDRKGSDKVVITELSFPAVTGIKNVRPYELHMVSDEPFNLISIT